MTSYRLEGRGSDLLIEVSGPDLPACLSAAVEAFAASLTDLPDDVPVHTADIEVVGEDPADLLVNLLQEAILRLDADGELAVRLRDVSVEPTVLRATVEFANVSDVDVHGDAPKAATWHELRLEGSVDGWRGQVLLDL